MEYVKPPCNEIHGVVVASNGNVVTVEMFDSELIPTGITIDVAAEDLVASGWNLEQERGLAEEKKRRKENEQKVAEERRQMIEREEREYQEKKKEKIRVIQEKKKKEVLDMLHTNSQDSNIAHRLRQKGAMWKWTGLYSWRKMNWKMKGKKAKTKRKTRVRMNRK